MSTQRFAVALVSTDDTLVAFVRPDAEEVYGPAPAIFEAESKGAVRTCYLSVVARAPFSDWPRGADRVLIVPAADALCLVPGSPVKVHR